MTNPSASHEYISLYRKSLPVTGTQIRLLHIKTSSRWSSPLTCELRVHNLSGIMEFNAVSYTWGSGSKDCHCDCNGVPIEITKSCNDMLRMLRFHRSLVVWVDQICIDQLSNIEKNLQVPLMASIYAKASVVSVWLGMVAVKGPDGKMLPGSLEAHLGYLPDSSQARREEDAATWLLAANEAVEQGLCRGSSIPQSWRRLFRTRQSWSETSSQDHEAFSQLRVLSNAFMRPYFGRKWIIQEVANARRIDVLIGHCIIRWDTMHAVARFFIDQRREPWVHARDSSSLRSLHVLRPTGDAIAHMENVCKLSILRSEIQDPNPKSFSFAAIMKLSESFKATMIHDCIYASISLVIHAVRIPKAVPMPQIDYTKSPAVVFTEFTGWLVDGGHGTFILSSLHLCLDDHSDFPSWCIDFSKFTDRKWTKLDDEDWVMSYGKEYAELFGVLGHLNGGGSKKPLTQRQAIEPLPMPSGSASVEIATSILESKLKLTGFVLDEALSTLSVTANDRGHQLLVKASDFFGRHTHLETREVERTVEEYQKNVNEKSATAVGTVDDISQRQETLRSIHDMVRLTPLDTDLVKELKLPSEHQDPFLSSRLPQDARTFLTLTHGQEKRVFGVTSEGWSFLTLQETEPGDSIAFFSGVDHGFVIRKCHSGYRLVGKVCVLSLVSGAELRTEAAKTMVDFVIV